LSERALDHIPDRHQRLSTLRAWIAEIPADARSSELQLEGPFVSRVFAAVLNYRLFPTSEASIWAKPGRTETGLPGTPDAVVGDFSDPTAPLFVGVVELKPPGTDLDKPQARRVKLSPVEQAFEYADSLLGVRWVLVTDMRILRLYAADDKFAYWEFDLSLAAANDDEFERLWWLISRSQLLGDRGDSATHDLVTHSIIRRKDFREGFYEAYFQVRAELFEAIRAETERQQENLSRDDLLGATQRLLDRLLFIFYCEDHPQQLIRRGTFEAVVNSAASLPGRSTTRIYDALKDLFHEIDTGSPPSSGIQVSGYNGELFKPHHVIDAIALPDDLNDIRHTVRVGASGTRTVKGVWGLHAFDFWQELGEHMLGSIFEESLSDLIELREGQRVDLASKLAERKRHGIYYTTEVLADYMAALTIPALVRDRATDLALAEGSEVDEPDVRLRALNQLRVADLACGSGAFLVSVYREELQELWRTQDLMSEDDRGTPDLFTHTERITQAGLLRDTLYGMDLLPQAVEIAKLALWLRSARQGERVSDLSRNIVAADSLYIVDALSLVDLEPGSLDLVIGNPPWGAELSAEAYAGACALVEVDPRQGWDSWELFLLLGLRSLREDGRLAFVLPDSFLYPDKAKLRRIIVEQTTIVRLLQLGAGWFGRHVRMDTMVLEVKKKTPGFVNDFHGLLLAGDLRKRVIEGRVLLSQVEAQRGRLIPQERSTGENDFAIELFRDRRDDKILEQITRNSRQLAELCDRGRGEEMAKAGLYWTCPSCLNPTVPGTKKKGGGYNDKLCPKCGTTLTWSSVSVGHIVATGPIEPGWEPWIDGDDLNHRYLSIVPDKRVNVSIAGWPYKGGDLYADEKILIRQAGVGVVATIDATGARCPQSVYIYRLKQEFAAAGYRHEFVLAALLSRTFAYVVFKAFGEVDPDKAHAKLTHDRLARLPIPVVDFEELEQRRIHDETVRLVTLLLEGQEPLGGPADRQIELNLRKLWGLSGDDGSFINGEFADLPSSQPLRELFPEGVPAPQRGIREQLTRSV